MSQLTKNSIARALTVLDYRGAGLDQEVNLTRLILPRKIGSRIGDTYVQIRRPNLHKRRRICRKLVLEL